MKTIVQLLILTSLVLNAFCMDLASKGYFLSSPRVRNILVRTGLANLIGRKASAMYDASNLRHVSDQGTAVRKAEMDNFDIVETDPRRNFQKRISPALNACCMDLASKGYFLSSPRVRNILVRTGLANLMGRKASTMYDASNFRYVSDQGTTVRKAEMDNFDIVETDPRRNFYKRISPASVQNSTKDEDRLYSERLFSVLNEMDKNSCISRLLCEIGAEPKSFGIIGLKIHHYLKSVPPVTWNSATFSYLEAFGAGLNSNKDMCTIHYTTCSYNLRRVMNFLWLFINPMHLKMSDF